jgi:hypothetical protein
MLICISFRLLSNGSILPKIDHSKAILILETPSISWLLH